LRVVAVALLVGGVSVGGAGASGVSSASSVTPSQVGAERIIYRRLDAALNFVGPLRVGSDSSLLWVSVGGDESGKIACARSEARRYSCRWTAKLIQLYRGRARVSFGSRAVAVVFASTTCTNPKSPGVSYPDLCALDPVPGMG
jgi:hypothetical protein